MAALASLSGNYGSVPTPVILSGALIVSIPTVALFLGFQRAFARGIGASL
jgi:multiple sugar transport system permease protein